MTKTFKPSEDGFYRINESQKDDLKKFFIKQMEKNPRTDKGFLSKKGVNVKTLITDSKGVEYEGFFKSNQDVWKFNRKDLLDASGAKRAKYLKLSNTLNTAEEQKAFKAKSDALPKGIEGDHILEVQETGPMLEQLELEKNSGAITTKEYNRQRKILQDTGIGDNPKNFQELTGKQNTIKQAEVARKNKAFLLNFQSPWLLLKNASYSPSLPSVIIVLTLTPFLDKNPLSVLGFFSISFIKNFLRSPFCDSVIL